MQPEITQNTTSTFVVKVKNADGSETRRFSFCGGFVDLANAVKNIFGIPLYLPVVLKWKDEEGDLITMSSDLELAEATKVSGQILHLILASPVPVANQPLAMAAPVQSTVPVGRTVNPVPPANWKQQRQDLADRWKAEKTAMKDQIRNLKEHSGTDKRVLKEQIGALKEQLRRSKEELKRMPKENVMAARYVADVSLPDGSEVQAGAQLLKTWRLRNEGARPWPDGSTLAWIGKRPQDRLGAPLSVPVASCAPGQEVEVSVPVTAPAEPGRYTCFFRLQAPQGRKFGQRLWIQITVCPDSASDGANDPPAKLSEALVRYAVQLRSLGEMGYVDVARNVRILRRFDGNLEKAVAVLIKRQVRNGTLPEVRT